jgi:PAT family beta-lactamase induction signal transducer AmpG
MVKTQAPRSLLAMVALLYAAEGLPAGIFHELVQAWLIDAHGVKPSTLGIISLLALPWTLKALWSPLVDRVGTAGKWIGCALLLVGCTTLLLPWMPLGPALWTMLGVMTVASATADVAIDGYTATVVPPALHGRVNGIRVAAYRGAMLIAGGGAIALAGTLPWWMIFVAIGALAMVLAVPCFRVAPAPRDPQPTADWLKDLWGWLTEPGSLALFAFVLLFKAGDAAMAPMVKPFWLGTEFGGAGLTLEELGLISVTFGAALTVAGAMIGGELATRWGLFRALWILGALQAISNLGYMAAAMSLSPWAIYGASMVESFCSGLGVAAFLAFLMRICEAKQAATRFSLLVAMGMLFRNLVSAPSGFMVEAWGYATYFGITFLMALPAFALLPAIRKRVAITMD